MTSFLAVWRVVVYRTPGGFLTYAGLGRCFLCCLFLGCSGFLGFRRLLGLRGLLYPESLSSAAVPSSYRAVFCTARLGLIGGDLHSQARTP